AARGQHVKNAVQNLAHIDRALAAAVLGGWDHRLDNRPFGVDQITWITKAAAVCCSKAVFRLPHRALPHSQNSRIKRSTESQPIHQTQQLRGSALSLASMAIAV